MAHCDYLTSGHETPYSSLSVQSLCWDSMDNKNWKATTVENNSDDYRKVEGRFYESMDSTCDQIVQV